MSPERFVKEESERSLRFLYMCHVKRKSMFSARIITIFLPEFGYRRILAAEASENLLVFSRVTTEVHFHRSTVGGGLKSGL